MKAVDEPVNRILRHVTLFNNIRQINTFVLTEASATSLLIRSVGLFFHSSQNTRLAELALQIRT
jgi:hypothetical protein